MDKGIHTMLQTKLLNLGGEKWVVRKYKWSKVTQVGSEYLSKYNVNNKYNVVNDLPYRTVKLHPWNLNNNMLPNKTWNLEVENYHVVLKYGRSQVLI